jgi:uncharacterized membrane protein HdeD (DUF308 family)
MAHIKRKYIDKHWLVFCIRGALALITGFFCLSGQVTNFAQTSSLISIFLLTMGVVDASSALYNSTKKRGWINSVIDSLVDVIAALCLLLFTHDNIAYSTIVLAIYTTVSGVIDIIHSIVATEDNTDRFIRISVGVCGAVMGFIILNSGDFEISTFIRFFGAYMLVVGISSFIYGVHNYDQNQEDIIARKESAKKTKKVSAKSKSSKRK